MARDAVAGARKVFPALDERLGAGRGAGKREPEARRRRRGSDPWGIVVFQASGRTAAREYKTRAACATRGIGPQARESSTLAFRSLPIDPATTHAAFSRRRAALRPRRRHARAARGRGVSRARARRSFATCVAKEPAHARDHDWLIALSLAARDHVIDRWSETTRRTYRDGRKRVYYFSLEFLVGRMLFDALSNLGPRGDGARGAGRARRRLRRIRRLEPDPRSATAAWGGSPPASWRAWPRSSIPAHGYGIRYDHGIFRQVLRDGWQHEMPEEWLAYGNPWEFERPEVTCTVGFGGTVSSTRWAHATVWHPAETVDAVAYDTPIAGWRGRHVNTLRLWSARATDPLSLDDFNRGDHVGALADRVRLEAISRVLYPSDETAAGQDLRLRQEFFFASASLQDLLRRHRAQQFQLESLPDHVAIQLNDTHPAIAVPELMRLLVDEHGVAWDAAWNIATRVFNYTNHTLLPEALETWPVAQLAGLLPRHMQIIERINAQHLDGLRAAGVDDGGLLSSLSRDRRERRAPRAHGPSCIPRRAPGERRVGAAHRSHARDGVPRPACGSSAEDRQQDQRHHVPPLAVRGESAADLRCSSKRWGRRCWTMPMRCARLRLSQRTPALSRRASPRQRRTAQGAAGRTGRGAHGRRDRPGRAVRRAHQAHPRVQAPAPQHAADRGRLPCDARRAAARTWCRA